MQLHDIKPTHKKKSSKRIGRGGKRGTYSGRGIKGQKSRAGRKMEPPIRGIIKRYHKLRGYNFNSDKKGPAIVGTDLLNKEFNPNDIVSPKVLIEKKIVRRISGKIPEVKILKKEPVKKSLIVKNCFVSGSARKEIEKAGGTIIDK